MKKIGCGMKATACGKHCAKRFKKIVYIIYASRTSRKRPEDIGGKVDSAGDKKGDKVQQSRRQQSRVEDKSMRSTGENSSRRKQQFTS
jgi:hypothetical protein